MLHTLVCVCPDESQEHRCVTIALSRHHWLQIPARSVSGLESNNKMLEPLLRSRGTHHGDGGFVLCLCLSLCSFLLLFVLECVVTLVTSSCQKQT